MALGFQSGAFQASAFQLESEVASSAFQRGAFQFGAFQVESAPADAEFNSGGWTFPQPKRKTRDEIRAERERMGILPAKVQQIVRQQAKRSVEKAKDKIERAVELPPISTEQLIATVGPLTGVGRDLTIWLALDEVRRGQELKAEMARQQVAWQAWYDYELQLEIERLVQEKQDEEDAQIVTLLFQRYMH